MKNLLFIAFLNMIWLAAQGQNRIGAMAGYGTRTSQPAIGINFEFSINEHISLSPGAMLYFPHSTRYTDDFWMEINFNGHYHFYDLHQWTFYGLGGLNYTYHRHEDKIVDDHPYTTGNININAGGGVHFRLKNLRPFSEFRYVIGVTNQVVVVAGIKVLL